MYFLYFKPEFKIKPFFLFCKKNSICFLHPEKDWPVPLIIIISDNFLTQLQIIICDIPQGPP